MAKLVLVFLAAALLVVLHLAPSPDDNALWRALTNALHAPAFALVAIGVLELVRRRRRTGSTLALYTIAFAVTAFIAAFMELIQVIGSRSASLHDWLRDLAGAAAGLILYASLGHRAPGAARAVIWTTRLVAVAVMLSGLIPVVRLSHAYIRRDAAFPVLGAFEAPWESTFWRAQEGALDLVAPPPGWPREEGARVARVRLEPGRYPGVRLREPYENWEAYDTLELSLYSPDPEPFTLSLRIHDASHTNAQDDRYNTRFEIGPGSHTLRIALDDVRRAPEGRELDLCRVAGLIIFVARLQEPRTLYLDDVRLVARGDGS
ncbi:MAG: VanZ family protein [Acidobacteriota bacterium]|nr:VanZ family protein [Acidobacteriota bacterium]